MLGGKREGAGRKVGVPNKNTQEIRDLIGECVDFTEVIEKLLELVRGVTVQEEGRDGPIIYERPPDTKAAQILLEFRFGKPRQQIDATVTNDSIASLFISKASQTIKETEDNDSECNPAP